MAKTKPGAAEARALIDIHSEGKAWAIALPGVRARARRAAGAALKDGGVRVPVEVGILLASDARVRRLNRTFRGKDRPTNVLSFPAGAPALGGGEPRLLGGIVLALGTCRREAREQGKTLANHVTHLIVHGVLHLLGHDHMKPTEARRMEALERRILKQLGIADPYILPRDEDPRPRQGSTKTRRRNVRR